MQIDRRRLFRIVAVLSAITAYGTIVIGGTVRGMDAGGACPDWPLCNNSIVPNLGDPRVAVEYAHRLVAALTSLLVLLTMAFAVLWHRAQAPIVTLSLMTFAVLVAQVAFGALTIMTITSPLHWVVVTIHLALGTATLALALMVALMALRLQTGAAPPEPSAG